MRSVRLCLITTLIIVLCACGSKTKTEFTISASDLNQEAARQLAATSHTGQVPVINCAKDLVAKVGNTETCLLNAPGNPNNYNAVITVTSVDNAHHSAGFRVDVAPTPNPPSS